MENHNDGSKEQEGNPLDNEGLATAEENNPKSPSSLVRKSTGPRTPEGKERSKGNALKYGIFSKALNLKGESEEEFADLLNGLRDSIQPVGALEEVLVDKLAGLFWRERRLLIAQSKTEIGYRPSADDLLPITDPPWDLFLRYETTLDRAIQRTLNQVERLQRMRLGQPVAPTITMDVSSS